MSDCDVHGNPPRLTPILEHADLQMRCRRVVFAFEAIGATSEHSVQHRHRELLDYLAARFFSIATIEGRGLPEVHASGQSLRDVAGVKKKQGRALATCVTSNA